MSFRRYGYNLFDNRLGGCLSFSFFVYSLYRLPYFNASLSLSFDDYQASLSSAFLSNISLLSPSPHLLPNRSFFVLTTCSNSFPALCFNCTNPCSDKELGFVLNPCSAVSFSRLPFSASIVVSVEEWSHLPTYFVEDIRSSRRNIEVLLSAEGRGLISCAARPLESTEFTSSQEIFLLGSTVVVSSDSEPLTINIHGLIPETIYAVQCTSRSLRGEESQLLSSEDQNITVISTACCAAVYFNIETDHVNHSASYLVTELSDPPTHPWTLEVMIEKIENDASFSISSAFSSTVLLITNITIDRSNYRRVLLPIPFSSQVDSSLPLRFTLSFIDLPDINERYIYCPTARGLNESDCLIQVSLRPNRTVTASFNYSLGEEVTHHTANRELILIPPLIDVSMATDLPVHRPIVVDLTKSVSRDGSNGRWESIEITVYKDGKLVEQFSSSSYDDEILTNYLPYVLATTTVPASVYMIVVEMCNSFRECSLRAVHGSTNAGNSSFPWLVSDSVGNRQAVNHPVQLIATRDISFVSSDDDFDFSWEVVESPNRFIAPSLRLFRSFQSLYYLPSEVLFPARLYEFQLYTKHYNSSYHKITRRSQWLEVIPGDLHAIIGGGAYQVFHYSDTIELDGGNSYDENLGPELAGVNSGMNFQWNCFSEFPTTEQDCNLQRQNSSQSSRLVLSPAGITNINHRYLVQLVVFDGRGRTSSASVHIEIIDGASIPVPRLSELPLISRKSRFEAIILYGSEFRGNVSWSIPELEDKDLAALSYTPIQSTLLITEEMAVPSFYFDISTSLLASRLSTTSQATISSATLTFSILSEDSRILASSSISISLPVPPRRGNLLVSSNSDGDILTVAATDWQDDNLPLKYLFSYGRNSSCHPSCFYPFQLITPQSYIYAISPMGDLNHTSAVVMNVVVYNTFDAFATVSRNVSRSHLQSSSSTSLSADPVAAITQLPHSILLQEVSKQLFQWSVEYSPESAGRWSGSNRTEKNGSVDCLTGRYLANSSLCHDREVLVENLFTISRGMFVDEKHLHLWLHLLHDILAMEGMSAFDDSVISAQTYQRSTQLLWYYLNQLLALSCSISDYAREVFDILEVILRYEATCLLNTGEETMVNEAVLTFSQLLFDDLLPTMTALPLSYERQYLEADYTAGQVNYNHPLLLLSKSGEYYLRLSNNRSSFGELDLAVYRRQLSQDNYLVPNQTSSPLTVLVGDQGGICGEGDNVSSSCSVKVTIRNYANTSFILPPPPEQFSVQCFYHEIKEETIYCQAANRSLSVICDGLFQGRINITCPYYSTFPVCLLASNYTHSRDVMPVFQKDYHANRTCPLTGFDNSSTTCLCPLPPTMSISAATTRKLQSISVEALKETSQSETLYSLSIVVQTRERWTAPKIHYLHYYYNDRVPRNTSAYPEFQTTIRSWITFRNLSTELRPQNVSQLSAPEKEWLQVTLRDVLQTNLKFFVTEVHLLNTSYIPSTSSLSTNKSLSSLTTVESPVAKMTTMLLERQAQLLVSPFLPVLGRRLQSFTGDSLVALVELRVNVTNYCHLEPAVADMKYQLKAALVNSSVSLNHTDAVIAGATISQVFVQLLNNVSLSTNDTYCLLIGPSPTQAPITSPGNTSGIDSAFAQLASHPDVTIVLLLAILLFALMSLTFAVLGNRLKPLIFVPKDDPTGERDKFTRVDSVGETESTPASALTPSRSRIRRRRSSEGLDVASSASGSQGQQPPAGGPAAPSYHPYYPYPYFYATQNPVIAPVFPYSYPYPPPYAYRSDQQFPFQTTERRAIPSISPTRKRDSDGEKNPIALSSSSYHYYHPLADETIDVPLRIQATPPSQPKTQSQLPSPNLPPSPHRRLFRPQGSTTLDQLYLVPEYLQDPAVERGSSPIITPNLRPNSLHRRTQIGLNRYFLAKLVEDDEDESEGNDEQEGDSQTEESRGQEATEDSEEDGESDEGDDARGLINRFSHSASSSD